MGGRSAEKKDGQWSTAFVEDSTSGASLTPIPAPRLKVVLFPSPVLPNWVRRARRFCRNPAPSAVVVFFAAVPEKEHAEVVASPTEDFAAAEVS